MGLLCNDFKEEGKVPVVIERFIIERRVLSILLHISFSTVIGTGSKSQYESDCRLLIWSKVAGVKQWSRGGVKITEKELGGRGG